MSKLSKEKINELLTAAEKAINEERSLSAVFKNFAEKNGRAKGGIRNLYYSLLKAGKDDPALIEKYPSLKNLKAEKNNAFTEREEKELFMKVQEGVKRGKSVRKTIKELARGDEKTALRYQNKYRNMMKERGVVPKFEKDERYAALKAAVDKLFDRIVKDQKAKEKALIEENAILKARINQLSDGAGQSKLKEFFIVGGSDGKKEKVDE